MLEAALKALTAFADPTMLLLLVAGTLFGVVVGITPGLGGTAAVALLLPFAYKLGPTYAFVLLIGSLAVVHTSDTISAVLLGAPGSASAAVTMMDGYALARKGQAGRALGAAFLSSMAGGLLGAIGLTLSIPIARPLVLAFGAPELFALCAVGISLAASLSDGKLIKGGIAALLGIVVGMIGAAPTVAQYRFTFGQLYLMDGLPLVAVALGIFGLAELAELMTKRGSIANGVAVTGGWRDGFRDFIRYRWQVVWGALIGIWAGILPGIGATAGTFMAYGSAVAAAKDRSQFGKGDIRGIIAPESANNAVEAGDLIPTLLFSIPGGTPSAILMGVLLMYGIQPGPRIVVDHLDVVYTIIWSFALASVLGAAICFLLSPLLARLTFVPFSMLAPGIVIAMVLGAYQQGGQFGDLLVMVGLALAGWVMKESGYPRAPFLIGYVLAMPLERYYFLTVNLYGAQWLMRPWVMALGVILVVTVVWSLRKSRTSSSPVPAEAEEQAAAATQLPEAEESTVPGEQHHLWASVTSVAAAAIFIAVLVAASSYTAQARLFPLMVATGGVFLAVVQAAQDVRLWRRSATHWQRPAAGSWSVLASFGWIAALVLLGWLLGFLIAAPAYVAVYLLFKTQLHWRKTAVYSGAVLAALVLLQWVLGITLPAGALFS